MHTRKRVVLKTVRVTTLRGGEAGLYYVERIGDYYVDRSEPSGVWHGEGARHLGLTGEVDDEAFLALMDGRHPDTDELLGRRYGERSVRGFDVTASAPKAASVLFAVGDEATRRAVLEAHDAAVAAMVAWIEAHAHNRYRVLGEVMTFDAQGIVAASFRQHTSRALDPQLHTHVVIPNRVLSPDGRWLALDARTVKVDQRTLSAVYHAGLRAELTRSLGVAWRQPEHGIAELRDVPEEVLEEFSSRTAAPQERIEVKLERFVETLQRQPTARERWRLEREAVLDSRPSKSHDIDAGALHREWAERALSLGHAPERVVARAVGRTAGERALAPEPVTEQALEALADKQSAWRPAELVRELAAAVPTDPAVPAAELLARLDRLAEEVAATSLVDLSPPIAPGTPLRSDGRPITEAAVARQLTTPAILAQEEGLVAWAQRSLARGGDNAVLRSSRTDGLDGAQREVAAAVAGTQALVLVVGPAGTGKTTALGPAVAHLREQGAAGVRRRPVGRRGRGPGPRSPGTHRHRRQAAGRALPQSPARAPLRPARRHDADRRRGGHGPHGQAGRAGPPRRQEELASAAGGRPPAVLGRGPLRHVRPPRRMQRGHRAGPGAALRRRVGARSQLAAAAGRSRGARPLRRPRPSARRHSPPDGAGGRGCLGGRQGAGASTWP